MVVRFMIGMAALLALAIPASAVAQDIAAGSLAIEVTPAVQGTAVGSGFDVQATITNQGDTATPALTAHLEIIDPTQAGSVDAEDWVPDLNQTIGALEPAASRELTWRLRPIAGGQFAVYVVAIPESAGTTTGEAVVASTAIPVDVSEKRALNPGGVLPVALLVPLILGGLLIAVRWLPRRRARRGEAAAAGSSTEL